MPKQIIKNVAQQIGQLAGETLETVKKQPQEMAGKILEQMGVSAANPQVGQQSAQAADEVKAKTQLAQMKARDEVCSQQLAGQITKKLEEEIEYRRRQREQQLQQRRATPPPTAAKPETSVVAPTSKPSRRFGAFGKRRIQSAQEAVNPDTSAMRVGG
jgi:t-SNARE complex subunit (syntaxin)